MDIHVFPHQVNTRSQGKSLSLHRDNGLQTNPPQVSHWGTVLHILRLYGTGFPDILLGDIKMLRSPISYDTGAILGQNLPLTSCSYFMYS